MNKRFLLISLGVLSIATAMQARSRSAEEAKQVAAEFYQSQNGLRSASDVEFTLVYSGSENGLRASTGEAPFYVFNIGSADGFVMVSGDDRVAPVIGYSLTSAFNPDNMPSNLRGWLEGYEKQIEYARTLPDKPYEAPETRAGEFPESVEPLIDAKWGQSGPYNMNCPLLDGDSTLTGCVATAAAQIMYYHKYPESAKGQGCYVLDGDTTWIEDMSQYTFDWDNMVNEYGTNATADQKEAVAELMKACGLGAEMNYDPYFSGAYTSNMAAAFVKNMGYDANVSYVIRDAYTNEEWINLLKSELQAKRPVLYSASSSSLGGHAFICDGYDTNNFFHINWGWDGDFDAYYNLNLLNPYDIYNAGYTGFSSQQSAVVGIQEPTDGSISHEGMLVRSFAPGEDSFAQGDTLKLSLSIEYATGVQKDFQFGFEFRGEKTERFVLEDVWTLEGFQYYPSIELTTRNFNIDPGTYELHFIYREVGTEDWKEAPLEYGSIIRDVRLVATEDEIRWDYELFGLSGEMTGYLQNADRQPTGGIFTIKNNSSIEYHPNIAISIESEKMDTLICSLTDPSGAFLDKLYLAPGEEQEVGILWGPALESGTYNITLLAEDNVNTYFYIIAKVEGWKVESSTANETISANDFSIRVYTDRIAVQSASTIRQIELYDISGRLAGSIRAANELPVDGLADGVYIVRVTTDEGVQTEKVILHR